MATRKNANHLIAACNAWRKMSQEQRKKFLEFILESELPVQRKETER